MESELNEFRTDFYYTQTDPSIEHDLVVSILSDSHFSKVEVLTGKELRSGQYSRHMVGYSRFESEETAISWAMTFKEAHGKELSLVDTFTYQVVNSFVVPTRG